MRHASGRGRIARGGRGGEDTDARPAGGQGRLALIDTTRRGEKTPSYALIDRTDTQHKRDEREIVDDEGQRSLEKG
jgi:hypothetical protein